jgi:hypothetical protein
MEDEKDQPTRKCDYSAGNSNKHEPTHHPEIVKKLAIIVSVDDAGMHGAFIDLAAVSISNSSAQHHRSNWCKRKRQDRAKREQVPNPREPFSTWQRWRIHMSWLEPLAIDGHRSKTDTRVFTHMRAP